MPALVNISVGSSFTTIGADGTMRCPLLSKKFLKEFDTEAEAMEYVNECIEEKCKEPYYVRCIMRENCTMFDYGSWSHFYAIENVKEGE